MEKYLTFIKHHERILIVLLVIIGGLFGQHLWQSHQERLADKQQIATNAIIRTKDADIANRDKAFNDFKETAEKAIAAISTRPQAVTVLQPTVPGTIAPQGVTKSDLPANLQQQLPGAPDTHYTLFTDAQTIALAKNAERCSITEKGLSTCAADKLDMQAKIDALTKANKNWQSLAIPRWAATIGVTKQQTGSYKPAAFLEYRFTKRFGGTIGAANNALFGGITVHFGNTEQVSKEEAAKIVKQNSSAQ